MKELIDTVYHLHRKWLRGQRFTTIECCRELKISRAKFMRLKKFMVDQLGAPVEYNRRTGRFCYREGIAYELPGLWFTSSEIVAMAAFSHIVSDLAPGYFRDNMLILERRLKKLLRDRIDTGEVGRKIKVLPMNRRTVQEPVFTLIAQALLQNKRLGFVYKSQSAASAKREVSPLTLVRYRDNWYLDSWCHARQNFRTFSMSRIINPQVLSTKAMRIAHEKLEKHFAEGYGIFSGPGLGTARLLFTGEAAGYAAEEIWHPRQKREVRPDGSVVLSFPYSDFRELVQDILRWGEYIEVLDPPELRDTVCNRLKNAILRYEKNNLQDVRI